ncbi:MAG: phosphatidylinositol-specific phospholipase C/glycerophosphodiester phosphodiesterase family protein [Clostridiales bacterium]|nr:phosphatidylinositol-specific phospholipase C/glycerophosphodiester phosphodiesterase family protein [Clostridiales bacterium]
MMKRILKTFIIWCALIFVGIFLIYLFHGENIQLLKIDMISLFEDNRHVFLREIIPLVIVITWFMGLCLLKKRSYSFKIKLVCNGREKKFNACYLKAFNEHTNLIVLISVLAALLLGGYGILKYRSMDDKNTYLESPVIIHAMGLINEVAYSNSLEAFQAHYANGERYFETDFSLTSDNRLVARHDWEEGWQKGIDYEHIPTEEVFLNTPIFGTFTPLSLKDIILLMQQHEDIYIITDTKDVDPELARRDISILVETAEEMDALDVVDRFVVQIYSMEMYEAIKDVYSFPNYIFTLYAIWCGDESEFIEYCRFCVENGIRTITMWDYRCADNPKLCKIADKYGIAIYVQTVNDQETAEKMFSLGVRGIYTDDETAIKINKE